MNLNNIFKQLCIKLKKRNGNHFNRIKNITKEKSKRVQSLNYIKEILIYNFNSKEK